MSFVWKNKLADYEKEYHCSDDCVYSGCPGHVAKFHLNHSGDTYNIKFHNKEIWLDGAQAGLLLDFFDKLSADQPDREEV